MHITGAGSCTITASQPGDVNFPPAPSVSWTFAIAKASQTITFAALANKKLGDPDFTVSRASIVGASGQCSPAGGRCTVSGRARAPDPRGSLHHHRVAAGEHKLQRRSSR